MTRRFLGAILTLSLSFTAAATQAQVGRISGFSAKTGESIYATTCQGCHMSDGKGAVGAAAYPSLAGNKRLVSGAYPTMLVLDGGKAMPPFGPYLTDEQIAAVVNYVRTHFGNAYKDPVTPATAKALRAVSKRAGKVTSAG